MRLLMQGLLYASFFCFLIYQPLGFFGSDTDNMEIRKDIHDCYVFEFSRHDLPMEMRNRSSRFWSDIDADIERIGFEYFSDNFLRP